MDLPRDTGDGSLADKGALRSVVLFGIPLVLGMGFHALFNLVDLWIVGKLGTEALAAVTIATMVNTVAMVICNGVSTSTIAFMARNIGFRNLHRANEIMRQSLLLVLFLSALMGLPPYLYSREIVVLLKAEGPEVIEPARQYLEIMSLGTITMFLLMQITAVLRSAGDGLWPMILLIGANLLNIVLDIALVFGRWGMPALGAPGAAWATVISRGVFCVPGLWVLMRGRAGLRLSFARLRLRLRTMWRLTVVALPASAQWVLRVLSFLALLWIVGDYHPDLRPEFGKTAQAAFGVGLRLDLFAIFSGFGWGAAASTLVGQNLGGGRPRRAERSTWIAVWLNVAMMGGIGIVYYALAPFLIRFFGSDKSILDVGGSVLGNGGFTEVVSVGSAYIRIVVFSYVFLAVSLVLAQALNGAGSTRTPMVIDTVGLLLLQLPAAFFLSRWTDLGLSGVWYSIVGANGVMSVVYILMFRRGRWKRKELL
ncbi:MAG: MATE family efflux transporter [Planctomycetes bacterium]|nr:MATE family efflux transporter [Planctomycetota bacterium]